ncbi:hypothetical protein NHX12_018683 [Muraenolepis orangiensis]|uniref:Coronin n=1 Tax=Muraenolepis orangiensis TaxID=630683 RepID=A0A9Q0IY66_9TELE|nr:hypothetical protein NHX12_018683 [Muraenolepis orangiensis]
MAWRPQFRCSKFRHVFGKSASKESCFDGVPIARSLHDNHFCAVNPRFLAVITESVGGGSFLVLSIHRVKVWEIPPQGMQRNLTVPWKELQGHSRRVGLLEWHPTARNILFSTAYDHQVIKNPVRTISHPDVVLSLAFNTDGSLMATTCKDRKLRLIEPQTGSLLQESNSKTHRAGKVLILGNLKLILTTGNSCWNVRQIALWKQDDLSVPLLQEDLDGGSGILFPFYDPDTHMLYIVGKGDGSFRYYEVSEEKPYLHYLTEYRSLLPQKGMAVMPKRGLDVSLCEVFRFYKVVTINSLIKPISMIVPRRSESYQEDIYPMTPGNIPAMTSQEWMDGVKRDPVLISLMPVNRVADSHPVKRKSMGNPIGACRSQSRPGLLQLTYQEKLGNANEGSGHVAGQEDSGPQEEILRLQELLNQKDVRIVQLELELENKNMKNA